MLQHKLNHHNRSRSRLKNLHDISTPLTAQQRRNRKHFLSSENKFAMHLRIHRKLQPISQSGRVHIPWKVEQQNILIRKIHPRYFLLNCFRYRIWKCLFWTSLDTSQAFSLFQFCQQTILEFKQVPWGGSHNWQKDKEINTHNGKANAVLLRLYQSVVIKRELSNTAKLSDFKSVIIYGHESWGTSEKILSQVQAAEMGLLWRVHGVTLHDEVRNHENCKALNVELLLRIEKYQLRWFGHVSRTEFD